MVGQAGPAKPMILPREVDSSRASATARSGRGSQAVAQKGCEQLKKD
jgi:hypothetical protein